MDKLSELKLKYYSLMVNAWNKNKPILIESFVEYYGENYRDLIVSRINEIEFVYYAPISNLDLLNELIPKLPSNITKDYIEYRDVYRNTLNGKSNAVNNFIGTTCKEIFYDNGFKDYILEVLDKKYFPSFSPVRINDKDIRTIVLPIFVICDKSIIHEVNHAVNYNSLAALYDNDNLVSHISKFGMHTDLLNNNYEKKDILNENIEEFKLEELLTERISMDIEEIFARRGGKLLYFNRIELANIYSRNIYLIEDFYNSFKELLKESRMTLSKNLLIETVGKDNYQKFLSLVNEYYLGGQTTEKSKELLKEKQQHYPEILEVVNLMNQHRDDINNNHKQNVENYYQDLENEGYTVIPLDNKTK